MIAFTECGYMAVTIFLFVCDNEIGGYIPLKEVP